MSIWDQLKFFSRSEFKNPDAMSPRLLLLLDRARALAEVPFVITDSWRVDDPDEHSAHELGAAVDIQCHNSYLRYRIVASLLEVGFERVGVYDRHIHADIATISEGFPEPRMWVGRSK